MNDHMKVNQMKKSLKQMIDFCSSQLTRSLQNDERIYYQSRKYALTECLQMTQQLSREG